MKVRKVRGLLSLPAYMSMCNVKSCLREFPYSFIQLCAIGTLASIIVGRLITKFMAELFILTLNFLAESRA